MARDTVHKDYTLNSASEAGLCMSSKPSFVDLYIYIFFKFVIEVELAYHVMLVLGVQNNDLTNTYITECSP